MHSLQQIASWLGWTGALHTADQSIRYLLIDSRQLVDAKESLFFALVGEKTDGHQYVKELYEKGVRAFVVNKTIRDCPKATFIVVEDVIAALQNIAGQHRAGFSIPILGITGSNGKTIVKEWLVQILQQLDVPLAASPRSFNSQIGLPLSLWGLQVDHELGIFEVGVSQAGEMAKQKQVLQPNIGLFTNLGDAHAAGFQHKNQKLKEKLSLFQEVTQLIYRADDPIIQRAVARLDVPTLSWASQAKATIQVQILERGPGYQIIQLNFPDDTIQIRIPFQDAVAFENAVQVACCLYSMGYLNSQSIPLFQALRPIAQRMEIIAGQHHCTILNDSYTNDLTALGLSLNFANEQSRGQKITLILSDILQSDLSTQALYQQTAALLEGRIDRLIGVGPSISALRKYLASQLPQHYFLHTTDLLTALPDLALHDSFIVLKGARNFGFEKLLLHLKERQHPTVLEVNLSAMLHNLRQFRQRLSPNTGIAAMVKAAAYGSGSIEVARKLEVAGIDYLVVAYPDEGIQLRQAGIQSRIMVLNAELDALPSFWLHQLEPEIYSPQQLEVLAKLAVDQSESLAIHIKINTGMNRLGFEAEQIAGLASFLDQHPSLKVASVFSHLAASDDATEDTFTHQQVRIFEQAYAQLSATLGYRPLRHILNSSGIVRFPQYQYELVRLGIGLYGLESSGTIARSLQTVLSLKSTISQIRDLAAGQTIGYGRQGQVKKASRIATIGLGYADGLPRSAGNGQYRMSLNGQLVPTIGAICMDMCMLDITSLPGAQVGDEVLVFGKHPSILELAAVDQTISYEMLTRISERVPRAYIQE